MHSYAARNTAGLSTGLRGLSTTPWILWGLSQKLRHAENGLGNVSGIGYNTLIPTNERQQMKIEHNLKFVTEFKEGHPVTQQVMALDEGTRVFMLESMLKDLVGSRLQPILDEINANGSYAILKVAE